MDTGKYNTLSKIKNLVHPDGDYGLEITLEERNTTEVRNKLPPCERTGYYIHEHGKISDDLHIYINIETISCIKAHALQDTNREMGGVLIGEVNRRDGRNYINITSSIPAQHTSHSGASVTFTHKTWDNVFRTMDKEYPDEIILGWYHTHPNFGIFLSGEDLFIHENFFNHEWLVAFVVDPVRNHIGFFKWKNGEIVRSGGYYSYEKVK